MADDAPRVGQIVEHHFLWLEEHAAGRVEGRKSRPCLVVAVEAQERGLQRVTVLPITSQPPRQPASAVEVPDDVRARMGLDRSRPAWIVVDQANVFTWPGFDLVPQANGSFVLGVITRGLFERVRAEVLSTLQVQRSRLVDRD
jgi:hypothetical protein